MKPSLALISALFISVSASAASDKMPTKAATPVVVLMPVLLNNPDFFEFTAEQKKLVTKVANTSNAHREELDQSILDARQELQDELLKYHPDNKLIQTLKKDIQTQEQQRLQLSIDCANGLRKALTAEQWKTLIELAQ